MAQTYLCDRPYANIREPPPKTKMLRKKEKRVVTMAKAEKMK